jgi:carbon starvation protein
MILISVATLTASIENITGNYIPNHKTTLTVLSLILVVILVVILYESIKHWISDLKSKNYSKTKENDYSI